VAAHSRPYAIWVSEVMLQQTQVSVVLPYWTAFLARFPDVPALARASLDDVLAAWRGLGYYARARNLHRAARAVAERHGWTPSRRRSMPCARSPASVATPSARSRPSPSGAPFPLVDGNVARVLARLFGVAGATGDAAREKRLWALADALVEGERPGDWNQALMELGATVCRPEQPAVSALPAARALCRASPPAGSRRSPPRRSRRAGGACTVAVAAARRDDAVLLVRRDGTGLFGGLWELPSVGVRAGQRGRRRCAPGGRRITHPCHRPRGARR
jgi:A/G-specific adenine glycosylase